MSFSASVLGEFFAIADSKVDRAALKLAIDEVTEGFKARTAMMDVVPAMVAGLDPSKKNQSSDFVTAFPEAGSSLIQMSWMCRW